jgi:transposase
MPATATPTYVGLDISKERLDYTIDEDNTAKTSNDHEGHQRLIRKLRNLPNPRVVCEASGGYERQVVAALLAAGIEVCLVQPGRARAFAHAEGLLAKNDPIDAQMLRRYGLAVKLRLLVPADPQSSLLRDLLDQRRDQLERLVEVDNQLDLATKTRAPWLKREQRFLTREIALLEQEITQHIDSDPTLRQKQARLQQLTGVGPVLAATVLAYLPELGEVSDATASALVGLAPYAKDSGTSSCPRHVRGGRGAVRHVLYMAALSAIRANRILRDFYRRLRTNGKPAMVAVVAVMRKMIVVLNRLMADPNFVLSN